MCRRGNGYWLVGMDKDLLNSRAWKTWTTPAISALVTLPLGFAAFFYAGISPMACDSCDGAVADRFDSSFQTAFTVFVTGLAVTLALLLASCIEPKKPSDVERRYLLAVLAPVSVLLDAMLFSVLVDWP
jgi:hypothetical protein